jgi:hypothetical protein
MSQSDDYDATLKIVWTQYITGVARNLYDVVYLQVISKILITNIHIRIEQETKMCD